MGLKVFNTLTRSLEQMKPGEEDQVRMYTCGPTVYDFAHIGNFRAYIFEDLLSRYLRYRGHRVTHVMNLTDVDDKTIRASREQGRTLKEFTQAYVDAFFEDLDTLHIQRADAYPAATDHVPEMIALIQRLFDNGYAYQSDDGSVYFNISRFKGYGKLSHIDISGLQPGARVTQDEYEKDHVADFALWKAWDEKDGDVGWSSPWGRGRPGWHIECSAMSMKHLGESFDIHCGGIDNMFPHHEDEIAQSEGATGKTFVRYWMHNAHLIVDGKKMSKSLNNFFTLRELLDKGYTGREIRYELMSTHYRQTLNFTFQELEGARSALARLDAFSERLRGLTRAGASSTLPVWADTGRTAIVEALDDDLNISGALGALFDMVHAGNRAMDAGDLDAAGAKAMLSLLEELDHVFGFLNWKQEQPETAVYQLVDLRTKARQNKNWAEADRLREQIAAMGWELKDTPTGTFISRDYSQDKEGES